MNNIIAYVYGNISDTILTDKIINYAILAPRNEDYLLINKDILNRTLGEEKVYCSFDKCKCVNMIHLDDYTIEFLNALNVNGMTPHILKLKIF